MSRDFVRYTPEIETIDPNPFQLDMSVVVVRKSAHFGTLLFSGNRFQLAANFPDGVKVFEVVPLH